MMQQKVVVTLPVKVPVKTLDISNQALISPYRMLINIIC